jgi:DNA excision repair protein ERCC-4
VDTREFNNPLPGILHSRGFQIIPMTLEVGDYLLAPEICIERKSVPDLIGSFSSGRMFTQIEGMTRIYKSPILLIEFDDKKQFTLQSPNDLSAEINDMALMSKICLLITHFPALRIIWSRSTFFLK